MPLACLLPEVLGTAVLAPGQPAAVGGPGGPPPPNQGAGWEVRVLRAPDYYVPLAWIPNRLWNSMSFTKMLKDTGSGNIVLNQDDPWWNAVILGDGTAPHALLDEENLWQVWQDGILRFEFLGETVTEQLVDPSEQRLATVTGPGSIATLKWAFAAPPGFPSIVYKTDALTDSFSEVDQSGNLVIDTGLWNASSGTGLALNPEGSCRITGTNAGTTLGSTIWDATQSLISVQMSPIISPDQAGNTLDGSQLTQFYLLSNANSNYYVLFGMSGSFFYAQYSGPDGTFTKTIASVADYATAMSNNNAYAYWQFSEANGVWFFWTSPDGQNWTKQWQVNNNWDATRVGVYFTAKYDSGTAEFATITSLNSNVQVSSLGGSVYQDLPIMDIWLQTLQSAQARGTIPFVTTRMSPFTDSFGNPWQDAVSVQLQNGTDLFTLLQGHAAMINADWVMQPGFNLQVGIASSSKPNVVTNDFGEGINLLGQQITSLNSGGSGETAFASTTVTSGATLAFDGTRAAYGASVSAKVATGSTAGKAYAQFPNASGAVTQYFRAYVYFTANPGTAFGLVWAGTSGNAICARLNLNTNGTLSMDTAGSTGVLTTAASIALNQWVRIEGFITGAAAGGQVSMSLYNNPNSTTPTERQVSSQNQNTAGPPVEFQYGVTGPGSIAHIGPFWMDELGTSDGGYLGPAGTKPASTAGTAGNITLGFDRSGTVIFTENGEEMTKQRIRARNQIANLVAAINGDGRTVVADNTTSAGQWGQRELWVQAAAQVTENDIAVVADAAAEAQSDEILSWTMQVNPNQPGRTVFRDFDVGDWVGLERPDFSAIDAVRVNGITVQVDSNGVETHELVLQSYIQWLQEQLTYVMTKMGGGFINAQGTTVVSDSGDLQNLVEPTVFAPTLGALGIPGGGSGGAPLIYNPVTGQWVVAGTNTPVNVPGNGTASQVSGTGVSVVNTVTGQPLNPNPFFAGASSTGWTTANATLAVTASPPAGCPQADAAVLTPTQSSGAFLTSANQVAVSANQPYALVADIFFASQSDMGIVTQITWYNAQGQTIQADSVDTLLDQASAWRQITYQDTAPAGATGAALNIGPHTGSGSNPLYVTAFQLISTATTAQGGTSVTSSGTTVTDGSGTTRVNIGHQSDGTVTVVEMNGPAPLSPDAPLVAGTMLGVVVGWDGLLQGTGPLSDFRYVQVHLSTTSGFTPSTSTLQGVMTTGGIMTLNQLTAGTTYYVKLVALNRSGASSVPSTQASAMVQSVSQNIAPGSISAGQVNFTAGAIGGINVTISATAPSSPGTGDLWYDGGNGYELKQWSGTAWVAFQYGTNAIAAGSVTAALIAANTITAAQIASGTITATQIAAATILGNNIAAGTVTASNIAAGTITASLLSAGIVVAGIVNGTTVTGTTLQNSQANPRTSINPDGSLTIRNSAGVIVFQVGPDGTLTWFNAGGALLMELQPGGTTLIYSSAAGPVSWDFEPPVFPAVVASGSSTASSTTYTEAIGTAVAQGSTVWVAASSAGSDTASSVTDSQGNTYTRLANITSSQFLQVFAAYNVTALGTSDSVTIHYASGTTNNKDFLVLAATGLEMASASNDVAASANGTSTSPAVSGTPVNPQGELALFIVSNAHAGGTPSAVSDGWQQVGQQTSTAQTLTAWASTTASLATLSPSATIISAAWAAALLTFIPQPSGQQLAQNVNPDFSGGTLTGWSGANCTPGGTTSPSAGSPEPAAGTITPTSTSSVFLDSAQFPVIAGLPCTISGWAFLPTQTDMHVAVQVTWYNSGGGTIRTDGTSVIVPASVWTLVQLPDTVPAGAVKAAIGIGPSTGVLTNTLQVTAVQLSYNQGWAATVPGTSTARASIATSTVTPLDGYFSLKVSSLGTGSASNPWGAQSPWFPVVPGAPVTMQAGVVAGPNLSAMSIGFGWYDASGNFISSVTGDQGVFSLTAGEIVTATITGATAPSNAAWASFFVQEAAADASGAAFNLDVIRIAGGLAFSNSPIATTDQYGNPVEQGITFIGLPNRTNILSVQDPWGNVLANTDNSGNITGQRISAATDVLIAGSSVSQALADAPIGLINAGWTPAGPWPSSTIGTTATALLELDQQLTAGRSYDIVLDPFDIQGSNNGNYRIYIDIFYTTDGSTPTTSSAALVTNFPLNMPSTAQGSCWTVHPGYQVTVNPTSTATYRMLVCGHTAGTNNGTFQLGTSMRLNVIDQGVQTALNTVNNGIALGSGSSGSNGAQNFTETFFASGTWAYWGSGALRDTNATMYQGAQPGKTGPQSSFIRWGSGSLGNNLNTVLNYTVQSVTITLACSGSYYAGGVTVSFHSSASNGSGQGSELQNWGMAPGQVVATALSSSAWAPFKAGGVTYAVLYPPSGSTDPKYYGSFYGESGGGNPFLTVVYSH